MKKDDCRDMRHQGTGSIVYEQYKHEVAELQRKLAEISAENHNSKEQIETLLRVAMEGYGEVREFVDDLSHVLGSMQSKHGEIAEHFNIAVRNAERIIHGKKPSATMENVKRTAPEDYLLYGVPLQSKYYYSAEKSLKEVLGHWKQYKNMEFGLNKGFYEIPKDQYEQIMKILSGDKSYDQYQLVLKRVKDIEFETGRPFEKVVLKGKLTYDEVQLENIKKSLDAKEQSLLNEASCQKKQVDSKSQSQQQAAREEAKPSFRKASQSAAVSALFSGGLEFAAGIYRKCKAGKTLDKFTAEDWKELGIDIAKATIEGGVSGYAIYGVTNYLRFPDILKTLGIPIASGSVSLCFGLLDLKLQRIQNELSEMEYENRIQEIFINAALCAVGAALGDYVIKVPILGVFLGSAIMGQFAQEIIDGAMYAAQSIASQNDILGPYCEELRKVDLVKIRMRISLVSEAVYELENAGTQTDKNRILINVIKEMDLPSVFGERTIDDSMTDPEWVLKF